MATVSDDDDGRTAPVVPIRSLERVRQRRRRHVREALIDSRAWIVAGLEGAIPLDEAVCEAAHSLRSAEREVLKASIEA